MYTGRLRHVFKFSIAEVAQKMARSIRFSAHKEKVGLTIAVKIKKACASAWSDGHRRCADFHIQGESVGFEVRVNLSGDFSRRARRQFRERILTLVAIACAEWGSQVLRGDFLKARQVFTRSSGITLALQRAGQPEFGRSMDGIERYTLLECSDRVIVLLLLGAEVADKIIGVGFVGPDFCYVFERRNPFFRVAHIFIGEAR